MHLTEAQTAPAVLPEMTPHRAVVCQLLHALLRTEEEFDAFCIDSFLEIQARFARGMDRPARIDLLLSVADPADVLAQLRQRFHEDPSAQATIEHLLASSLTEDSVQLRAHWEMLETLYTQREGLLAQAKSTEQIDREIVSLKRSVRQQTEIVEGTMLSERYRLVEYIGRGGFARVWRAFDRQAQRSVAVKILHNEDGDVIRRLERFQRGARQMQGLDHPHIVRVLDGPTEQDDLHYFVMEYLPSGDLYRAVLSQKLDRAAGLRAILAVGDALAYSHSRGLVHRDVKPHNILLDEQNEAQLSDFDLVWAPDTTGGTRTSAMGTFLFAAPEEMEDASQVDHRADIYSLAMTTVFVLFGRNLSRRVLDDREGFIATLDAGTSVKELLKQATAPEQESRPATVAAFCQALTAALDSEDNDRVAVAAPEVISAVSAHAEPEPPARVITIRKKFGREEMVPIGGLLLVLLVAGGFLWWLMR